MNLTIEAVRAIRTAERDMTPEQRQVRDIACALRDGYFRAALFPKGLAVYATPGRLKFMAQVVRLAYKNLRMTQAERDAFLREVEALPRTASSLPAFIFGHSEHPSVAELRTDFFAHHVTSLMHELGATGRCTICTDRDGQLVHMEWHAFPTPSHVYLYLCVPCMEKHLEVNFNEI